MKKKETAGVKGSGGGVNLESPEVKRQMQENINRIKAREVTASAEATKRRQEEEARWASSRTRHQGIQKEEVRRLLERELAKLPPEVREEAGKAGREREEEKNIQL